MLNDDCSVDRSAAKTEAINATTIVMLTYKQIQFDRPLRSVSLIAFTALAFAHCSSAQERLGVQSSARPFGLDIVNTVSQASSDPASTAFFNNALPDISNYLNSRLGERVAVDDNSMLLDPTKLNLRTESDVRVYFIGEGAGYHNTLGFNTTGVGVDTGDPSLIFPDASSFYQYSHRLSPDGRRNSQFPLVPGDFVDLGTIAGGTTLDFFLIANGARNGKNVYTTQPSANPDGINHLVSFAYANPGSSYLVIGFEDLFGGGDRDFNDLLFAVDIGAANIAALTATPEPATWLTLGTMGGIVGWLRRRQRRTEDCAAG